LEILVIRNQAWDGPSTKDVPPLRRFDLSVGGGLVYEDWTGDYAVFNLSR